MYLWQRLLEEQTRRILIKAALTAGNAGCLVGFVTGNGWAALFAALTVASYLLFRLECGL